jgi:hypothetical protein
MRGVRVTGGAPATTPALLGPELPGRAELEVGAQTRVDSISSTQSHLMPW